MVVKCGVHQPTKTYPNPKEPKGNPASCAEMRVHRNTAINAYRAELGQYLMIINNQFTLSADSEALPNTLSEGFRTGLRQFLQTKLSLNKNILKVNDISDLKTRIDSGKLSVHCDRKRRKSLTMCRVSVHSLAREQGRHRLTCLSRRAWPCPFCPQEIETGAHFLLQCTIYK